MQQDAAHRHYNRAPIVEAMLAFRIVGSAPDRLELLQSVGQKLIADYPIVATLTDARAKDATSVPDGYSFTSLDERQMVKARLSGFSFHRLEPYDRWESFVAEARRTWQLYFDTVGPTRVTNVSVRYVNVLKIPYDRPLHEFFTVYPAMPNPDVLFTKVFLAIETEIKDPPGTLAIRFTPTGERDEEHFRMLLANTFTFGIRDEATVWDKMDLIRKVKNETFESQLRDELKETLA